MGFFDFLPKRQEPQQQATAEQLKSDIMPLEGFGSLLSQSYNPDELIGQKSIRVYAKMENDDQVKPAINLKVMATLMSGWEIRPASEEQADIDAANFVTENLDNIEGTFSQKLEEILSGGLVYGYSVSEKVYEQKGDKWYLKKLKSKKPDSIQFEIDTYGNLTNLLNAGQPYPVDKFVIFSHNKKYDNNYGTSDLRAAYRAWWYKENTYKYLAMYVEKYATPPLVANIEGNLTPTEESKLKSLLNRIQNNTVIMSPKGVKIDFIKIGDQAQIYERAINLFDAAISKSILMPSQLGLSGEPSTGSNAKAQTHFDLFMMIISKMQKSLEEVVNEQIIRQLVSLNFTTDKYPRFSLRMHESENVDVILKQWNELLKNGALTKQIQDEEWIRGLLGAPILDQEGRTEPQEFGNNHQHKTYASREPSIYEKNVNYAQIDKESEQMIQKGKDKFAKVLSKTKDDIVNRNWEGTSAQDINRLGLKYMNELQQTIKGFVGDAYDMGYEDSQKEIKADKSDKKSYVTRIKPEKALKFFETKSFWMSGVIEDTILKAVKGVLYKALEAGWHNDIIKAELIKLFAPYVDTGVVSAETVQDYRLDTIVRTISNEVYNAGRKESQLDPANDGFVVGMMYSSIMDKHTTELCSGLDGKIFLMDNPYLQQLYPPNHFNERSIMTAITKDMLPIPEGDLVTDAEAANAVTLKGEGF